MTQPMFADRIRRIDLVGPCVRIEFTVSRAGDQEGEVVQEQGPTIVMPIDGFAQGATLVKRILDQLVERKILRPADNQPNSKTEDKSAAAKKPTRSTSKKAASTKTK